MMSKVNCFSHERMTLTIVSPTIVADERVLTPQEYVYDNHSQTLYVLNETKWFSYLQKKGLLHEFEKRCMQPRLHGIPLYSWLEEKLHQLGFDVESELGAAVQYKIPAESKPTKERGNGLNQVILCMRSCNGRVYIPGSTIKGAIRTAILHKLLTENNLLQAQWFRDIRQCIRNYENNPRQLSRELKKLSGDLERKLLYVLDFNNQRVSGVLRDVMRGIRCSDALPKEKVTTRVVQKIDIKKTKDAYNALPIYKEMIEPGAEFSFTITLEPSMTKHIGIERVGDIVGALNDWFGRVVDVLEIYFGKAHPDMFESTYLANCMIGSNTNFLCKTLYLALESDAVPVNSIKKILHTQFRKHAHLTDTSISPRTLKGTNIKGEFYMTGEAEIQIEE